MKYVFSLFLVLFLVFGCKTENNEVTNAIGNLTLQELKNEFNNPSKKYYPETWFHLNGNNISKEGLTLDLEAIKEAGLQGIHLFNKAGRLYPNVEPIKILSPEWEDMIRHTADECKRLGLKFTMQNCPGWSMTGGPWVPVEEAQREVVETVYHISGNKTFDEVLKIDSLYKTPDYDYKDIQVLAFPTVEGDDSEPFNPSKIETNNTVVPWEDIFNPNSKINVTRTTTRLDKPLEAYRANGISKINNQDAWVKATFNEAITLRTITLPQSRHIIMGTEYPKLDVAIKVEALIGNRLTAITTINLPDANWNDRRKHLTLAIPETTSNTFVFTFGGKHTIAPEFIRLSSKPKFHNHEARAAKVLRRLEKNVQYDYAENTIISSENIINLTDKMTSEGNLTWEVPNGNWTIVRFGHINMRLTNKPAVPEATGWESSKLDKIAIENHLRNGMIGNLIKDGGPIGNGKLHGLLIDSWESHVPTWTINSEDMFFEFETRRGYSMKTYLPTTMGYIVDSPEITTKFLRDLRHTMDEVFIDNFFKHFATVAHDMGAEVYTEGAGGEVLPIDPMRYYGVSDIPMTEFWYPKAPSAQNEYAKPIYNAASATHLYNKPMLAAEACTQLGVKWNEHPFSVKYLIDYNFAKGVNHLVFHTFSHTPQTNVYPGSSFGGHIGFPLVRQQTWWAYMNDWTEYLSRNQFVLQQGEYAADVLRYYGDHYERPPFDLDYFPKGYRFDYLNAEVLQEKLSIKNGKIHVKDGGDYRVITLRDSKQMLLSTAKKLKDLVEGGAVILGDKPLDSPSLMDDENDLKSLRTIADELWGDSESGVKQIGKGKVYWGKTLDEVLEAERIAPDVIVPEGLEINWIHRKTNDADIYFVASKMDKPVDVSLSFNAKGSPQIWDAFTGIQEDAKVWKALSDRTNVALSLPSSGSAIIVFTKADKTPLASKVVLEDEVILNAEMGWFRILDTENLPEIAFKGDELITTHSGEYKFYQGKEVISKTMEVHKRNLQLDWTLSFEKGWETPETFEITELKSLTELSNEAIKHYSGTTTYSKSIQVETEGKPVFLDLGKVANIAEVFCNGKKVGVKWAPPFVFDISNVIQKGVNKLEIKVTNTWRNQLIFDNSRPKDKKKTWTTNPPKKNEIELESSGLIGPVVLKLIN
ncbi:Glycosyl hydrolases family 2, sugar binding domain [Hyunsoonleella jejuensis]|uniref:Glycosyl hydrolases family 2, sugar binding domain n=1 Tax=Hyunsoonleella jejuensis TaxID=419940 RepID=A0A1H9IQC3_9FLAO|nr:glycosyl hydrolase [Hyunsoonleella jejuensis]SEQ76748.1 Glycosyl hydrolases family 2, sugar binding domain [Hyunsoonleella jejuensis]